MSSLLAADERVKNVELTSDVLSVDLMDGRTIIVPLAWYPRLLEAMEGQRNNWRVAGGGYGIHWPDVNEDLSGRDCSAERPHPANRRREHSLLNAGSSSRNGYGSLPPGETEAHDTLLYPRPCSPRV